MIGLSPEEVFVGFLEGLDTEIHESQIRGDREELAAILDGAGGVFGIGGETSPEGAVLLAGGGDGINGFEAFGVPEISRHAEGLAEIRGADEEHIDFADGGDLFELSEGFQCFNLDDDESFAVGAFDVFGERGESEASIVGGNVQTADAARGVFAPADDLFRFVGGADLCGHDAAGAAFEAAADNGIVGGGESNEGIHSLAAGGEGGDLELFDAVADMFEIEPEGVEASVHADHLDEIVVEESSHAADDGDVSPREFLS